jgi:hypothetical protein
MCKLLVHTLYVATDSRAAVGDDPVVIIVDRGDEAVEGRELKIGEADSHVRSVFRAWGKSFLRALNQNSGCSLSLIFEHAS